VLAAPPTSVVFRYTTLFRSRFALYGPAMSNAAPDLPDSVTLAEGEGGLPVVRVATAVAAGEVYLHGAHVTAWTPAGSDTVIWVRDRKSTRLNSRPVKISYPV